MSPLREMPHTADVGFELQADRLDELFGLAAAGLREALGTEAADEEREAPVATTAGGEEREGPDPDSADDVFELSRPDLERLLVEWLRELLYRASRSGLVPEPVEIEIRAPAEAAGKARKGGAPEEPGEGEGPAGEGATLRARVRWRPAAAPPSREIKGVTYHGLSVRREGGSWHARVVLDV